MAHKVIAMKTHDGNISIKGFPHKIKTTLPDGCIGLCFIFESKKAARKYWGKDVSLMRVEIDSERNADTEWTSGKGK